MQKTEFVRARLEPILLAKMELMRRRTGLNTSEIIRRLIQHADAEPPRISTHLPEDTNKGIAEIPRAGTTHGSISRTI